VRQTELPDGPLLRILMNIAHVASCSAVALMNSLSPQVLQENVVLVDQERPEAQMLSR